MGNVDIVRAWKDEEYRLGLDEAARGRLPESPVGGITELSAKELSEANGGMLWTIVSTLAVGYCLGDLLMTRVPGCV